MPLQLVLAYDRIALPVRNSLLEAWRLQFDRAAETCNAVALSKRHCGVCCRRTHALPGRNLRLPAEKQIRYATAIARELNVALSGNVLRYRGTMTEFIVRFAGDFKTQCAERSRFGEAANAPEED